MRSPAFSASSPPGWLGAWTDRVGARKVLLVGLVVALTAAVVLGACLSTPP
jgi:MFS family permease